MLVIERRFGESFFVGAAEIWFEETTSARKVKVVIDAPPHIRVLRSELLDKAPGDAGRK